MGLILFIGTVTVMALGFTAAGLLFNSRKIQVDRDWRKVEKSGYLDLGDFLNEQ